MQVIYILALQDQTWKHSCVVGCLSSVPSLPSKVDMSEVQHRRIAKKLHAVL